MDQLLTQIRAEIAAILPEITALRRALHQSPELAMQETGTRAAICNALQGEALTIREPLLGTDVIAEMGNGEKLIGLRADMDAVATAELSELPYRSRQDGVMHACGHDGHTAMLVGAAKVLARLGSALPHRVRCIFQPGEEVRAAGRDLVLAGACDGVDEVYALHAWPGLPAGAIISRVGPLFAAATFFTITVKGRGCHAAQPERGLNPIPIAAELARRLQEMHCTISARERALVSVCTFQAGTYGNVIPNEAVLQGTGRYIRAEMADEMEDEIRGICNAAASETGAEIMLDYVRSYELPVINTAAGYEKARYAATLAFGDGVFRELPEPFMGAEDFSYYLPGREGALLLLGQGEESSSLHSSTFNFNDDTLEAGILMYCLLAL